MFTRRQFIAGAATVVAAAATGCRTGLLSPKAAIKAGPPPTPTAAEPVRIALLSDPHCQWSTVMSGISANPRLVKVVKDMNQFKPDYWIVNGDIADGGLSGQHEAFKEVMATVAAPERVIVTTGNHEFYDKEASDAEEIKRFCTAFGLEKPYSNHLIAGVHVVMLATEQWKTAPKNPDWAWLTKEQLAWFEQVLADHKDKFTIVFLHQPVQETVLWTARGQSFAGSGQDQQLAAIVAKNPQVRLWFSGHTHQLEEAKGNVVTKGKVTYVGLGSAYYNFVPSQAQSDQGGWPAPGGFKRDFETWESRFMEVYPDKVVVRARENSRQLWLPGQEITIART